MGSSSTQAGKEFGHLYASDPAFAELIAAASDMDAAVRIAAEHGLDVDGYVIREVIAAAANAARKSAPDSSTIATTKSPSTELRY